MNMVNDMKEEKREKVEAIEEVKEEKIGLGKIFIIILFVLFTLIAIFFLATFIRWKAEISDKKPILYRGQEEIKVDKLVDFYGFELSSDLKDNEAIFMYCTSEYGKDCIMPNYSNFLENNFREPITVISIIIFIDLLLIYILLKDSLNGKRRTYIYGTIIILWGLFGFGRALYKVADYYKEIRFNKTTIGEVTNYLRSDYKDKYIPVYRYEVEKNNVNKTLGEPNYVFDFPTYYTIKGDFKDESIKLYYEGNYELVTPKKSMLRYIAPALAGLLTVVIGSLYLTINKRFKKKEEKEKKKLEEEQK